ncbi:MAG: cephalosporin deacetylase [Chloroflexi bacterium]|nr:MAG: cephalosporin deacetylase [Chloroflexota bacterium]
MSIFDLSLEELQIYRPALTRQPDFEQFWQTTLAEAAQQPLNAELTAVDYPVPEIRAFSTRYAGWQGASVAAWYLRPSGNGPFPAMVFYHGYTRSKEGIYNYLPWVLQGYAVLAVDVRGQSGETADTATYSSGHARGWMTKGILSEYEYYYRGVYVDAVRALDFLAARPDVDITRVGLTGFSQGGGLSLAVAALDNRPALTMPGMPFLCHFERPLQISRAYPYWEFADYLRDYPHRTARVFKTLSYFDNLNLADKIKCPVLVSVGLIDEICPPSTVFAVYNHLPGPKQIAVFPYHQHERPQTHWHTQMQWANHYLRGVAKLNTDADN